MSDRRRACGVLLFTAFAVLFTALPGAGQTPARTAPQVPRMPSGKPNFTGLWQVLGTADWDIRDHSAQAGPFFQLGATGAMPAGQGIVDAARFLTHHQPRHSSGTTSRIAGSWTPK